MNMDKIDKIVLKSKEELDILLKWRDNNKDLVREFKPTLNEGLIMFGDYKQYFKQEGNVISYKVFFGEQVVMNLIIKHHDNGYVIQHVDHIFPKGSKEATEGTQDVVTIHASIMAYMAHYEHHVTQRKELVTKTKKGKLNAGKRHKDRVIKMGRKVYDVSIPESVGKEKRPYTKHAESFPVTGHWRHYKSGKVKWIESYRKGNKDAEHTPRTFRL